MSYSIPAPKFEFGDLLQHTFIFPTGKFTLVGKVISRNWTESPDQGYWEYEVKGHGHLSSGKGQAAWSEFIEESELSKYELPVLAAA